MLDRESKLVASMPLPDGSLLYYQNQREAEFAVKEIFGSEQIPPEFNLPSDGTFLDVGANIGVFTLKLASDYPDATIYTFEPVPETFDLLALNAEKVRGDRICKGLGGKVEKRKLEYFPNLSGMSSADSQAGARDMAGLRCYMRAAEDQNQNIFRRVMNRWNEFLTLRFLTKSVTIECPFTTISQVIKEYELSEIDLLKIDTEGVEYEVISGISDQDWSKIKNLIVEVHDGDESSERMRHLLEKRGYSVTIQMHDFSKAIMDAINSDLATPVYIIYATSS